MDRTKEQSVLKEEAELRPACPFCTEAADGGRGAARHRLNLFASNDGRRQKRKDVKFSTVPCRAASSATCAKAAWVGGLRMRTSCTHCGH